MSENKFNKRRSATFPNPASIKRPVYLPELKTREEREDWNNEVMSRYRMLTEDIEIDGKIKISPYNKALGGCNRKSIPQHDWENIVNHCLWVASFTYDRNKAANIERYNLTATKPLRVPKSVCPLPNYFWKLIYFTSCTWFHKYGNSISNVSLDADRSKVNP